MDTATSRIYGERLYYISIQKGHLQWKLKAEKGLLYRSEPTRPCETGSSRTPRRRRESTHVTGKYARYFMNQRDLEVYGSVTTQFADGFVVHSDYVSIYRSREKSTSHRNTPPKEKVWSTEECILQVKASASVDRKLGDCQIRFLVRLYSCDRNSARFNFQRLRRKHLAPTRLPLVRLETEDVPVPFLARPCPGLRGVVSDLHEFGQVVGFLPKD